MSEDRTQADCWNVVGVRGDRSCPELGQHGHCRNCPVHFQAARRQLELPVDDDYRAHWADVLREPQPVPPRHDASALVFRVGSEWLGLPTPMVLSVLPLAPVQRLPHRSDAALLGVVNAGGRLVPAVSLEGLLAVGGQDAADAEPGRRHVFARLLLVQAESQRIALPVAELHGIVRYAADGLRQPAATIEQGRAMHLAGVIEHDGLSTGLLDAALLRQSLLGVLR